MYETERKSMEFDAVIVGAGPAGLAAEVRMKQLDADLSLVVLGKRVEIGAHVLPNVGIDPYRLLPGGREERSSQDAGHR